MTSTASPAEVVYTAVAALGALCTLVACALALADYAFVRSSGINGYRRRYARKLVREAVERLGVFAGLIAIGVIALRTPPPLRPLVQRSQRATGLLLLVIACWKTGHAIWSLADEYWIRLRLWTEDRAWHR